VIGRALRLRQARRELVSGRYQPLATDGPRKAHLCAFARIDGSQWSVCVVPRLTCEAWRARPTDATSRRLRGNPLWPVAAWWHETVVQLPPEAPPRYAHVLSDDVLEAHAGSDGGLALDAGDVLGSFPVALLTGNAT
jgi:maltooligosyltrehalose synthase